MQITDADVQNFYNDVLDCRSISVFTLKAEETFSIFGIKKEVIVHSVSCEGLDLELFVDGKFESANFGHVCFQSTNPERIIEKAHEKGYRTFVRKRGSSETYFISDSNLNLFEIKKIIEYKNL